MVCSDVSEKEKWLSDLVSQLVQLFMGVIKFI